MHSVPLLATIKSNSRFLQNILLFALVLVSSCLLQQWQKKNELYKRSGSCESTLGHQISECSLPLFTQNMVGGTSVSSFVSVPLARPSGLVSRPFGCDRTSHCFGHSVQRYWKASADCMRFITMDRQQYTIHHSPIGCFRVQYAGVEGISDNDSVTRCVDKVPRSD